MKVGGDSVNERTVIAKFTGTDGSLGYRYGRVYTLRVREPGQRWPVEIVGGGTPCPYSSRQKFRENWQAQGEVGDSMNVHEGLRERLAIRAKKLLHELDASSYLRTVEEEAEFFIDSLTLTELIEAADAVEFGMSCRCGACNVLRDRYRTARAKTLGEGGRDD